MPIYEYRCDSCGHELDALQKMNDAPLSDCPACNKAELKKQISAPSFRLKGSGWYETDFKNKSKPKDDQSAAKEDKSGKKAGAESKSDSGSSSSSSNASSAKNSGSTATASD